MSPSLGLSVLGEVARLEPRLVPEAVPSVVEALLDLGSRWGAGQMRRLRPAMLARFGAAGELDDLQERLVPVARLSQPWVASGDVTQYQLVVTPEQAAVLEAAIGPLSAPAPNQETGERDLRPAGQRRVEALAEVCRRSSAVDADAQGGEGAAGSAAALHVTIALSDLQEMTGARPVAGAGLGTGAGEVFGSTATGVLLSPGVLRRVACDAALVPHVLGSAGEDLDLGRVVRLFTRAQRRRLWRRDRCCTFPGCAAPGSWTRAHHVLHWADGGLSDVDNAALLCQRHHTVVHTRRLWASVRARPDELGRYVVWDLSVGSYDRQLDQLRRDRAGQDPPPLTRQRLLDLVASVTSDAEADRRLAQHDLDRLSDAWQQWQHQLDTAVGDDDPAYRAWHESYLASVASTIPAAA
ncbi:MAG: HNH endonuclease signature motif containing protein [Ornithinibacter sp.]